MSNIEAELNGLDEIETKKFKEFISRINRARRIKGLKRISYSYIVKNDNDQRSYLSRDKAMARG